MLALPGCGTEPLVSKKWLNIHSGALDNYEPRLVVSLDGKQILDIDSQVKKGRIKKYIKFKRMACK